MSLKQYFPNFESFMEHHGASFCMYVCMYVRKYIHMYVHTYVCIHEVPLKGAL